MYHVTHTLGRSFHSLARRRLICYALHFLCNRRRWTVFNAIYFRPAFQESGRSRKGCWQKKEMFRRSKPVTTLQRVQRVLTWYRYHTPTVTFCEMCKGASNSSLDDVYALVFGSGHCGSNIRWQPQWVTIVIRDMTTNLAERRIECWSSDTAFRDLIKCSFIYCCDSLQEVN